MIRNSNGYNNNRYQYSISEESRLINFPSSSSSSLDKFFKEAKAENITPESSNHWEKLTTKLSNIKYLNKLYKFKPAVAGILLIYFIFSFNIHFPLVEYQEEVFTVGKERTYLKKSLINNYNSFIKNCTSGILLDKNNLKKSENPKISVTIPVYNGGKYLYYSLRSIQNQKLKDIEIILIDDFSTDNSVSIIEKYQKEDPRIKLIKNKSNRKILYTKSIGALNAKGKYIFQFDQDDILIRDDVFDLLFYEAENNVLDLVQFRDIIKSELYFNKRERVNYKFKHMLPYKETHFKLQPELKDTLFTQDNNYILWGLLIKNDLYKKAIYTMWPIIINYKLSFFEDHTITVLLVIFAKRYKYLNNFCLLHLMHKNSMSNDFPHNKEFYLSFLFFTNNFFDYYLKYKPEDIHIIFNLFISFGFFSMKAYETLPNLFFLVFKKIFSNNYLSYDDKINFIKKLEINNKYKLFMTYELLMNSTDFYSIMNYQYNPEIYTKQDIIKEKPKYNISIIIYLNEFNFLENTIKSIEYQNFTNYEIILMYDSEDKNDLNKTKNYAKSFRNIQIINNNEQLGLYYSYSTGIIQATGDYILLLKSGYTLSNYFILDHLYNNLINEEVDILEFNLLINYNGNNTNGDALSIYKCIHVNTEIQLNFFKYNLHYKNVDEEREILTNKLIKSNLLKNTIRKYAFNKRKNKLFDYFDEIILYILNKNNATFKHIEDYCMIGYINSIKNLTLFNIINEESQAFEDSLFYINFIFDNSKKTNVDKKFVLYEFYNIMGNIYNKFVKKGKNNETIALYRKFEYSNSISIEDKEELKFYYDSLNN